MSFIWPGMLWLLLLVPALVVFYFWLQQRRKRFAARYGSLGIVHPAVAGRVGIRRHIPALIFLAGLTILIVALARPQMELSLPRIEGTVILAFDVSGSMAADDIQPSRLESAKEAAREFVLRQPETVLIGVVAFSDGGLNVLAPTNDQEAILASINRLQPERGTSLANGIAASLNAIAGQDVLVLSTEEQPAGPLPTPTPVPAGTYDSAVIVLLTDGENNIPPDPLFAAQVAADQGVRIHTIGVGSPDGAILQINEYSVHTQLDEAVLKQISLISDGSYFNAENEEDLKTVYDSIDPELVIKTEMMETTAVLAGISILIFLVGATISLLWFSRMP